MGEVIGGRAVVFGARSHHSRGIDRSHERKNTIMALVYGVVRARPDLAKREDGAATPQLELRAVDASGQPWRVAVNVQSDDGGEQQMLGSPLLTIDPAGRS